MAIFTNGRDVAALTGASLASMMFGLEISSVPVILPTLERVLGADFGSLQWIMNAYTIAVTTVLMATGALADRYGRKRCLVASVLAFGATSIACGLAPSAPILIAARALQGLSGGAMLICQIAVMSQHFQEGPRRAKAFGLWGIVFGFGLGFGPIIGGAIAAAVDWRWVFLVHGPVALVTLAFVFAGVTESRDPDARRLDIAGMATLSLSVFCLVYLITQGPTLGPWNATTLGLCGAALASLAAFVAIELRVRDPMFDFAVFRIRRFSGALIGSMGMNFSFWPFMIFLPIYFQAVLGYDTVTAGLSLLAYTLPTLVVPPLGERLAFRFGPDRVIPAGLTTIGLGFALMRLGVAAAHPSWVTMLPGAIVAGTGLGLINTPVTNTTTGSVPAARAGMASGIDMSARMISLALNIALMGFVLVGGIASFVAGARPGADAGLIRGAAERIAAGDTTALGSVLSGSAPTDAQAIAHAALVQGFGWVLVYGAASAWMLALLGVFVFRTGPAAGRAGTAVCAAAGRAG